MLMESIDGQSRAVRRKTHKQPAAQSHSLHTKEQTAREFIYTVYILNDQQEKVNKCMQIRSDEMRKNINGFLGIIKTEDMAWRDVDNMT